MKSLCPICNGVKFVYPLLPSGKPDYSKVVPCLCVQKEAMANRLKQLLRYSNLGSLARLNFNSLKLESTSSDSKVQERFSLAETPPGHLQRNPKVGLSLSVPAVVVKPISGLLLLIGVLRITGQYSIFQYLTCLTIFVLPLHRVVNYHMTNYFNRSVVRPSLFWTI